MSTYNCSPNTPRLKQADQKLKDGLDYVPRHWRAGGREEGEGKSSSMKQDRKTSSLEMHSANMRLLSYYRSRNTFQNI